MPTALTTGEAALSEELQGRMFDADTGYFRPVQRASHLSLEEVFHAAIISPLQRALV